MFMLYPLSCLLFAKLGDLMIWVPGHVVATP
jgi:hypothetical protein